MIYYWLLPSLIVFILILLIARYENAAFQEIEWLYFLFAVVFWPLGAVAVMTIAVDYFLYKEHL